MGQDRTEDGGRVSHLRAVIKMLYHPREKIDFLSAASSDCPRGGQGKGRHSSTAAVAGQVTVDWAHADGWYSYIVLCKKIIDQAYV